MTKLNPTHPFVKAMQKAEKLEQAAGTVTDEVLEIRKWAKENYPELLKEYIAVKEKKQEKEKQRPMEEKAEVKRLRKIRNYSILKGGYTKKGFGKGPKDK